MLSLAMYLLFLHPLKDDGEAKYLIGYIWLMNRLPIIITLDKFTFWHSHNESTMYVTGKGPVLELVDMTVALPQKMLF